MNVGVETVAEQESISSNCSPGQHAIMIPRHILTSIFIPEEDEID